MNDPLRYARQYILLDPSDCDPPHSLDLSLGSRDSQKVELLAEAFAAHGFDPSMPALVGYPKDGRVQLLSGTHRHEAARRAEIPLPVTLYLRSYVEAAWGTPGWERLIADIPVKELTRIGVVDDVAPALAERIDLSAMGSA